MREILHTEVKQTKEELEQTKEELKLVQDQKSNIEVNCCVTILVSTYTFTCTCNNYFALYNKVIVG